MDIFEQLQTALSRLDQLDSVGEWIARECVHEDPALSQSGSFVCALTSDIQERLVEVAARLEEIVGFLDGMDEWGN